MPDKQSQIIIDAWQAMAERAGLSKIRLMSAARSKHLATRIKEVGVDGMLEAIAKLEASDHCCGRGVRTGPYATWRAGFDFLLQSSSLLKTLEGKYDNRVPPLVRPQFRNPGLELLARDAEQAAAMVIDGVPYFPPQIEAHGDD